MTSVAFLGLGAIGAPMARHLASPPFTLTVWNRTASRAREFGAATGARVAATPAEAARGAEFVVTCLPTSADVAGLLDGSDGIFAGIASGAVFIDCTSGDPGTSRRIAQQLGERGVHFLDAPVSGGTIGAEKGTLTVMCGGERAVFDRAQPVLDAFGEKLVLCGPVGAGHALKAVNNAMLAVHLWSVAEGLAALTKAGVAPAIALDVINASSGRSNTSQNLIPQRVLTREFPRTFRLRLLDKDVGIAADVAREQRVPSPLLQLTRELLRVASSSLDADADHVELVRVVERWADVEIR